MGWRDFLKRANASKSEGDSSTLPDKLEARKIREETEELYQWLKNQL
jgi:hypothetical protein